MPQNHPSPSLLDNYDVSRKPGDPRHNVMLPVYGELPVLSLTLFCLGPSPERPKSTPPQLAVKFMPQFIRVGVRIRVVVRVMTLLAIC